MLLNEAQPGLTNKWTGPRKVTTRGNPRVESEEEIAINIYTKRARKTRRTSPRRRES